ncbi:MAG: DUF4352 domain-containing protein [Nanohaloarchaea archaeon]|nr:DUF4352 domain-containing protein [Candidatus Nanohaloarchaea archaeon]
MPAKKTAKKIKSKQKSTVDRSVKDQSSDKITFSVDKKSIVYMIAFAVLVIVSIGIVGMLSNDSDSEKQDDIIDNDDVTSDIPAVVEDDSLLDDSVADDTILDEIDSIVDSEVSDSDSELDTSYISEAGEIVAEVGVAVETDVIDVTLDSYELSTSHIYQTEDDGENITDTARAGKQFLIADFSVKNKGATSVYIGSTKITLISDGAYTFEPVTYEGYDVLPKSKRIYTGTEINGRVVFEIPLSSEDMKIRYSLSGLSISDRFVTWFLK